MTACVNRKHSRRVAAVISASLVGALSLGIAPVAAMANEGIEVLTADDIDQVEKATVSEARDNAGQPVDPTTVKQFVWDGEEHFVTPTKIKNDLAWSNDLRVNAENDLEVAYVKVVSASAVKVNGDSVSWLGSATARPTDPGTYYAVVKSAGDSSVAGNNAWVKFEIVDNSYTDLHVIDGADLDDTSVDYDGTQQVLGTNINLVSGGKVLTPGVDYKNGDGQISIWQANDVNHANIGWQTNAGDYVMEVEVKLSDGNYEKKQIPFSIKAIDLSTAELVLDKADYATVGTDLPLNILSVNGVPANPTATAGLATLGDATLQLECSYTGDFANPGKGEYTFTVRSWKTGSGSEDIASKNVINTGKITVVRYTSEGQIRYNKQDLNMGNAGNGTLGAFNPALIDAVKPGTNEKLPVKVTYTRNGEPVEDITAPGKYVATIMIDDSTHEWGGKATIAFHVAATRVDVDEIYASYKGETLKTASLRDIYSGSDLMENFSVRALDEDDKEVPADQLTVTVTNAAGEKVDSVVEAGTYTITIGTAEGSIYEIKGGTDELTFTVDPVKVLYTNTATGAQDADANAQVRFTGTMGYGTFASITYVHTGKAVVPGYEYDLTENIWGYKTSEDWIALPDTAYKAEYQKWNSKTAKWEDVEECVEVGTYRALLSDADADDSYTVDAVLEFYISDQRVFADVANNEWYSEWIFTATSWGYSYMNGYAGTQFFGPNDSIKRGDVAVTLFKMAGGTLWVDSQEGKDEPAKEFDTPFSDVDSSMYYAQAIQWAQKAGIVKGDEGTDKFRPEDTISRQELAVMLARYAKMTGVDTAADASALEGYTDASAVADYAADSVAWAVEAEVMGQGVDALRPTDSITRAEVAAMTVRVQPDGRLTDADFIR